MQILNTILLSATQLSKTEGTAVDYIPIVVHIAFALVFVAGLVWVSHLLGPHRPTNEKLETFAGGLKYHHGPARQPVSVKYFLVAILFVLFDVEVIFFYPYAVNFKILGWPGFMTVLIFISLFITGLIYLYKRGALDWEG